MRVTQQVRKYAKALEDLTFANDERAALRAGDSLNDAHKQAHLKRERRRTWLQQRLRYYQEQALLES